MKLKAFYSTKDPLDDVNRLMMKEEERSITLKTNTGLIQSIYKDHKHL